jgi:annexin A13
MRISFTSSNLSSLQRAICLWVLDPPERDALLANLALQKPIPDYKVLVEIACMRSPEDMLAARRAYRCLYKHSLEEDLASRTIGDIRRVSNFKFPDSFF